MKIDGQEILAGSIKSDMIGDSAICFSKLSFGVGNSSPDLSFQELQEAVEEYQSRRRQREELALRGEQNRSNWLELEDT